MQIVWSKMIEKFAPQFGLTKEQIEDAYNKPDKTSILGGNYITVKFYGGYAILVTFTMQMDHANFMNAYKIFPDMINVDVDKSEAIDVLTDFMGNYGMLVEVPGVGKVKTHFNEIKKEFFQGILDMEKYLQSGSGRF
jgi:hypothetical protein